MGSKNSSKGKPVPTDDTFGEYVANVLRGMQPGYPVDVVSPREILINGRRLDPDNLLRMVNNEPDRGQEIVELYLEQLLLGEVIQLATIPFDFARPRIMPRIRPESIFEHLSRDQVAHVPFVNDTVITFVTDLPDMTISITTDQLTRWKVPISEIDKIARHNLDSRLDKNLSYPDIQTARNHHSEMVAIGVSDGYDASRLLFVDLFERMQPTLGKKFYVAIPARDCFTAFNCSNDSALQNMRGMIQSDFMKLPYPITPALFTVTSDGVVGSEDLAKK